MRYLDGGVASGFKHVDPDHVDKKLLQVKGKRNVRVRQVCTVELIVVFNENFPLKKLLFTGAS